MMFTNTKCAHTYFSSRSSRCSLGGSNNPL